MADTFDLNKVFKFVVENSFSVNVSFHSFINSCIMVKFYHRICEADYLIWLNEEVVIYWVVQLSNCGFQLMTI